MSDWFAPGYRAGGPITSLFRMCELLAADIDFYVVTNDHDWHNMETYKVPKDTWTPFAGIHVWYTANASLSLISQLIKQVTPDIVYWNGIYSPKFHALPLIMHLIRGAHFKMIVAPRGMLNANAIALKATKKRLLLKVYGLLGMEEKLLFHATSSNEVEAILKVFPRAEICRISNIPALVSNQKHESAKHRKGFIAVGRISPVKNTLALLECFNSIGQGIHLIGNYDDQQYFLRCRALMNANCKVKWTEGMPPKALDDTLHCYRFFVSMTLGENFGHAIIEALAAGCPVIISDQTPWNDLEAFGAGWVLPLNDQQAWVDRIKACKNMDDTTYLKHSDRARSYVNAKFDQELLRKDYLKLFQGED